MKKKIVLAVASIACLASCGGGTPEVVKDLTPVEDTKGMEVAEKIRTVQQSVLDLIDDGQYVEAMELLPNHYHIKDNLLTNGKERILESGKVHENIFDNSREAIDIFVDAEKLYMGATITTASGDNATGIVLYYYYKDGHAITLAELGGLKLSIRNIEMEQDAFKNSFASTILGEGETLPIPVINDLIAVTANGDLYLDNLCDKFEEEYVMLDEFKSIQNSLKEYDDKNQYFNWKFGSDDDKSLSVHIDTKFDGTEQDGNIRLKGYASGYAALYGYLYDYDIDDVVTSVPDLIVFKNNFLSSFESNNEYDLSSVATEGVEAGKFYKKLSVQRNVEVSYEAETIVYPNLEEYIPMNLSK